MAGELLKKIHYLFYQSDMKFYSQESLYLVFILIVVGGVILFWSCGGNNNSDGYSKSSGQKVQHYISFILLAIAALIVFLAASQMSNNIHDIHHPHQNIQSMFPLSHQQPALLF